MLPARPHQAAIEEIRRRGSPGPRPGLASSPSANGGKITSGMVSGGDLPQSIPITRFSAFRAC